MDIRRKVLKKLTYPLIKTQLSIYRSYQIELPIVVDYQEVQNMGAYHKMILSNYKTIANSCMYTRILFNALQDANQSKHAFKYQQEPLTAT